MTRYLPAIILILGFIAPLNAQNPHGADLKIDCAACHSPERWSIGADYWKTVAPGNPQTSSTSPNDVRFHHGKTTFELTGQHANVDCRTCHETLVFSKAASDCFSCHIDIHQQTVGMDCARCHNTNNWLVDNITQLHVENGFPLLGRHNAASCIDCHISETGLQFHRIGNDCINCHRDTYEATTAPNHLAAGFSTDCVACHDMSANEWFWVSGGANHLFFPLTKGHQINDCTQCHIGGNFVNTPTDCFACHEADFRATTSPDHEAGNFPTNCAACHTTDPGWNATDFTQHDQAYFPIYSGKHRGEWNQCTDCHYASGDFKLFSCTNCHEHNNAGELANDHDDVSGYSFSSNACYSCHPKGEE